MKLNNKGFAISTIMYMILILAVILIIATLSVLGSRKLVLDKQKSEALDNIYTLEDQQIYEVTYTNINNNNYPTQVINGRTLTVDFAKSAPVYIIVKVNNEATTDYTYQNGVVTISDVSGNIEIINNSEIITFTANGTKYEAYEDMTWEMFINSNFNSSNLFKISGSKVFIDLNWACVNTYIGIGSVYEAPTNVIISDKTYDIIQVSTGNICNGGFND